MKKSNLRIGILPALILAFSACTSTNINSALGTLKNPAPVFGSPKKTSNLNRGENPLLETNYKILLEARKSSIGSSQLSNQLARNYVAAGFALSDFYCDQFLRDAEESQRRRRFARAVTNDAGTAITSILGLANAGQNVVSGVAAGFGLGDNLWRNYDEAFVVSPDLSNVRSLVLSAQDNFRERTLGKNPSLPRDYSTAQTVILRYANFCSTLGMQALLNQSATKQEAELKDSTKKLRDNSESENASPAAANLSITKNE